MGGTILTLVFATSAREGELQEVRARAEVRARVDLARRFGETPDSIQLVELAERTWPDEQLGCRGRRMTLDPQPVPGFRMVLSLREHRFIYHADRTGRVVACDRPLKPVDPIR